MSFTNGFISRKSPLQIRNKSPPKENLKHRKKRTSVFDIPGFLLRLVPLNSRLKQEVICSVTDSSCSLTTS